MASFTSAVLLAAAMLMAGRLAHAAGPSMAEVFWRAVLPGSAVPDAVLRLLRPDSHSVSEGHAVDTGRSNAPFNYQNYRRSSPADRSEGVAGSGARDDTPFSYGYKQAPSEGVAASGSRDDTPFSYDYKQAPSQGVAGSGAREEPFRYDYITYEAPSSEHLHAGVRGATARGGGGAAAKPAPATTVFFHEEAVRVGERLRFHFKAAAPAALGILPRRVADSIPFATAALPSVLALFGVSPGSSEAAAMAETVRTCEMPPLAGEARFCATSLEALVERAVEALGTRDVRAVTSALPRAGLPPQAYTVHSVRRVVGGDSFVACHDEAYPYTVYRCHGTGPARAYLVGMEGARGGGAVTVATVCHTDTSRWNPEHISFRLLGTKPGGSPVCHLMPYGHIIWARNVNGSSAA